MKSRIRIGTSTCGLAAGADAVVTAAHNYVDRHLLPVDIQRTGCLGACHREPLVEITEPGGSYLYGPVTPERLAPILGFHFTARTTEIPEGWRVGQQPGWRDYPFLGRQIRITTQLCGVIDPFSLEDYLEHGGYQALREVLRMEPEKVIEIVKSARLRGRGGAGFPTGRKWEVARRQPGDTKFVICNADEGDPGAFMNRSVIEGDPHRVLEGMLIAAWAIGAQRGYLYVRAEYPLAVRALRLAIRQAEEYGACGKNIFGSGMDFKFIIKEGAGAFVCGEETALMHSIEGQRGMPRMRPPYPAEHGLWGYPTNINNVETYASLPSIILSGPNWYAGLGTPQSGGTKAFSMTGAIRRAGLVEVPIGLSLHELLTVIGGGTHEGHSLKAVQLGGPSGGCIPASMLDTCIDYEEMKRTGAIMGSGGMVVVDETTCMVKLAEYFLSFTQDESCGKCIPCRVGTRQILHLLRRITAGQATPATLEQLRTLCDTVRTTSLCGLGQTAPNPVLTTMRYFEEEYRAHVEDRACPAGSCTFGEPPPPPAAEAEERPA